MDKKPLIEQFDEEEEKPKTLWDMFIEYVKAKEEREKKQFIDTL